MAIVSRGPIIALSTIASIVIATLGGCGTTDYTTKTAGQERRQVLLEGVQALRTGDLRQSHELLEQVVNAPPVAGITDEALFRLALVQLAEEGTGTRGTPRSVSLLESLQKQYPLSQWTPQAAILLTWLGELKNSRERDREHINRLMRENRELLRDNRELRQNIERLKNIDLDIEKKRSRP